MKKLRKFTTILFLFAGLAFSAHAGFSSIYVWGDSLSSTTNDNSPSSLYYGQRYSNGRTWVEVLAQRQGLGANSITNVNWDYSSNNLSFYGQYSQILATNVTKFIPPPDVTNCVFVVWVNNADFVGDVNSSTIGASNGNNNGTNLAAWITAINQHLTNHFNIITNLYAKGCRSLIAPDAADITEVPEYNNSPAAWRVFVRKQIIGFNASYNAMLHQIAANTNYPGLTIYNPDIFSLLDNVLTNATAYGLTNVLYDAGQGTGPQSIDADTAFGYGILNSIALNGPGTNYIFWDPISPTAKFSEVIADYVQQYLSPVQLSRIAQAGGSNRLDVVNMPVGLGGLVLSATNLVQKNWLTNSPGFSSLTVTQSVLVPVSGPQQFYRLKFPWQWTWP